MRVWTKVQGEGDPKQSRLRRWRDGEREGMGRGVQQGATSIQLESRE